MFHIPKGKPLEHVGPPAGLNLPERLSTLKSQHFTGYLHFGFSGAQALLLLEEGKLISAFYEAVGDFGIRGLDATKELCRLVRSGQWTLTISSLPKELTVCLHALFHGVPYQRGQEVRHVDMRALLDRLKSERVTGTLRFYTGEHSAFVYYHHGALQGFFRDGIDQVEVEATETQQVAALPGARFEVMVLGDNEQMVRYDLMELFNIDKVCQSETPRRVPDPGALDFGRPQSRPQTSPDFAQLENRLKEMSVDFLGKAGPRMLEKLLGDLGGRTALHDPANVTRFLDMLEKNARLLTGGSRIQEMLNAFRNELQDSLMK